MKKFALYFVLCALIFAPFACNTAEKEVVPTEKTKSNKIAIAISGESQKFLSSYYGRAYSIGRQIETRNGNDNVLVSEVLVGTGRARGYLVTNKTNGAPVFFSDVDRNAYTMTSIYIATGEKLLSKKINENPEYSLTKEFDFYTVISLVNDGKSPEGMDANELQRRPFWGWTEKKCGECDEVLHLKKCSRTHYALWIKNVVETSNIGC